MVGQSTWETKIRTSVKEHNLTSYKGNRDGVGAIFYVAGIGNTCEFRVEKCSRRRLLLTRARCLDDEYGG